jgi:hypothetical protein
MGRHSGEIDKMMEMVVVSVFSLRGCGDIKGWGWVCGRIYRMSDGLSDMAGLCC